MSFFKGFNKGMKSFGYNLSTIINCVLLTIVYVFGVGATFIFSKILRKKFLDVSLSKEKETYWVDLNLCKRPIEKYYRQF